MGAINLPNNTMNYAEYTWSNRPTLAKAGDYIIITDIGPSSEVFFYTGTRWAPLNGNVVLGCSNTSVVLTGTTTNTTLANITVKGGLMAANSVIEILTIFEYTNSANNKTIGIRFNGTGGTLYYARSETTSAACQVYTQIRNMNSTSSQLGMGSSVAGGFGITTQALTTSSIATNVDVDINIRVQLALGTETATLHGYRVVYRE